MKRWIAHERDDTGWPTEACLIVSAHTQTDAKHLMGIAISAHTEATTRQLRERLYAIFIEAPEELADDDPRQKLITDPDTPTFLGFDPNPAADET